MKFTPVTQSNFKLQEYTRIELMCQQAFSPYVDENYGYLMDNSCITMCKRKSPGQSGYFHFS